VKANTGDLIGRDNLLELKFGEPQKLNAGCLFDMLQKAAVFIEDRSSTFSIRPKVANWANCL